MGMRCTALCLLAVTAFAAGTSSDDFYRAIRANDLTLLESLMAKGDVNAKDRHGATPLMYAAAVGSVDAVKALLARGADAKAKNSFDATALMWGVANPEKVRLLLDAGADVNARSKQGMTPLLIAASNAGSMDIVRLLIAKGADPKATNEGGTALLAAAIANDLDMARLFIEKGVDGYAADIRGNTALHFAASNGNLAMVKLLLSKGADVNAATTRATQVRKGPVALSRLTALMYAAPYGTPELVRTLIDAGAKVNARDIRDMTPLMLAVSSETQDPAVVRLLLEKGADVKAKSNLGETALDWARKFGNPEVMRMLEQGGGTATPAAQRSTASILPVADLKPEAAIAKSIALLQKSGTEFFKESGCVGCHHQNFTAMAVAAARRKGIRVDEDAAAEHLKVVKTQWTGAQEFLLQRLDPPGASDTLGYSLLGLAAVECPADAVTDAMVVNVAQEQQPDGSWGVGGVARSPIEEGTIARTAMGIRTLQHYGSPGLQSEFEKRLVKARDFLLEAQAKTTDDWAMQLLGLKWSGASTEKTGAAAQGLLHLQRENGGWAGNQHLESDAYATGEALCALHESGALKASDARYERGVAFLLRTQQADGSWHVKSRAVKFQPYFQSGFPYDHDQWISASGTAMAAMALANAVTTSEQRAAK
jgi:ankyrin repeat protein